MLHIGLERTGSTALQVAWASNVELLRSNSIAFPMAPSGGGQARHELVAMGAEGVQPRGPWDDGPNGCTTLLLSDERLSSRIQTERDVARLHARFRARASEVRALVVLRSQHELLSSRVSVALRMGHPARLGFAHIGVGHPWLDYRTLLSRWVQVFGRPNLDVLLYSSRVVGDASQRIGIGEVDLPSSGRVHESLSGRAQNVLAWLNQSGERDNVNPRTVERILSLDGGVRLQPARQDRISLMERLAESNEWVRERWFPERSNLFDPVGEEYPAEAVLPDARSAMADFARLTGEVDGRHHRAGEP